MKKTKKISVIISTLNRKDYLQEAIDSVLMQTYKDIEIIIIDDYSKDGTKEFVDKKYKENKNVNCYRNEKNMGCGYSRKYAMEKYAKGEYIVFLDDDDKYIDDKYFEKAIKLFSNNKNLSMVCAAHKVKDIVNDTLTEIKFNYKEIVDNKEFFKNFASEKYRKPIISVAIIKKEALEKANYHKMKILNDTTIFLRALLYGPMGFINEPEAEYLVHGNNISFNCNTDFIIENLDEKLQVYKMIENNSDFNLSQKEKEKWLENQLDITIVYFINGSKPSFLNFRKLIKWYKKNINKKEKIKELKKAYKESKKEERKI